MVVPDKEGTVLYMQWTAEDYEKLAILYVCSQNHISWG